MSTNMTRRQLIKASAGLGALGIANARQDGGAEITVGITSNTRPDWSGGENFLKSIREASEVGYHWIETFWPYLSPWKDNPDKLIDIMAELGLKMVTVSNGGKMNTRFQDPTQRKEVIADHMRLVRFLSALGCGHLKINCGAKNPGGNTTEIYGNMAETSTVRGKLRQRTVSLYRSMYYGLFSPGTI